MVLATIIKVVGSSYRKEGAMLLCMEDGSYYGLISGGCLEEDLVEKAKVVYKKSLSHTLTYDLSEDDDLSWGQGSGCNGVITVLLEPITEDYKIHLAKVQQFLSEGKAVLHKKYLSTQGVVVNYSFMAEGEQDGNDAEVAPSPIIYQQMFRPKPRLLIFGAGIDVRPVVTFAHQTGFETIVTDWRPAYCQREFFPDAAKIIVASPIEFLSGFNFRKYDAVIIMTHNYRKDEEILSYLLKLDLLYIGVLGPRQRTLRLLKNKGKIEKVHSPIGIPIGAVGPEEIAISIMAEIIKVVRMEEKNDCWNLSRCRK